MASRLLPFKLRVYGRAAAVVAVLLALSLIVPGVVSPAYSSPPEEHPHSQDHVLVKLQPGFQADQVLGQGSKGVFGRWRTQPVPPGRSPDEFVADLRTRPGVVEAELDYEVQLDPVASPVPLGHLDPVELDDPGYDYQWHFPAIQLEEAWADSTGAGVVVAIVDSGISKDGDDLDCHTFVAPYNAITRTTGVSAVQDDSGHGTHVAGTVSQCTNNGVGVAGVAFDAALMPVKVLDGGSGKYSDVAEGIEWARAHGADVINLSLGGPSESSAVDDAIEAATDQGIVIVAASGNSGASSVIYPARHPDVIAVGATEFGNERAPYSNGGSALDLVAPGGNRDKDENGDGFADGVLQETFVPGASPSWSYWFFEGTSMAAPHVSGAAALILALHPQLGPTEVREILEKTALDLGPAGFDTFHGHGLVQLHDALTLDIAEPQWGQHDEVFVEKYGEDSLTVAWDAASDNVAVTAYRLRRDGATVATTTERLSTVTGLQPGTAYEFDVMARDDAGNWSKSLKATLRTAIAFTDTPGTTFYNDILWMSGEDITRGCNPPENDLFCPDDPVTRGQMAAFVVRALGLTADDHGGFVDVPESSTFAGDIGRLATAGITRGCNPPTNDRFCPDDPVTRGQMAAFVVRALGLTADDHGGFVDVPEDSTFAGDIGRLATAGITRGCNPPENDRFCPNDPVTRGQFAAFFHRGLG